MPFFGNLLNSIPGVGHVKGLIHYVCDDNEAGNEAMLSATRSAAVWAALSVGALAGPFGAIAAGAAAGACYDTGAALGTDGKHVTGVAKIFEKPGEISSWVDAGIDVVGDGFCGVGAGNVAKEAGKTVAKQTTKDILKQEAKIVAKAVAMNLAIRAATHAAAAVDSAMGNGQGNSSTTPTRQTSNNLSGNQKQQSRSDNNNSNQGDDPDNRRNGSEKKKECQGATVEQLREFIRIVEQIQEFMQELSRRFMSAAEFRDRTNQLYREFILAAIPLMNDPTIRMRINNGFLEIVTASRNQVGISRHTANLLSRAIHHALVNWSAIIRPCNRSSCRFCPHLRELQSGLNGNCNTEGVISNTGNCETRGVIYCFYCNDCRRIVYAGQTVQRLRDRTTNHLNNERSGLHRHIANNPGHRIANDLLDIFDIIIMWTSEGVDTELDDSLIDHIIRNWEVFFQWLSEAHTSLGGESKK